MVKSSVEGQLVVHTFKGEFSAYDMVEAKAFVEANCEEDANHAVLWDLRGALLSELDQTYSALTKAIVNPQASSYKRAFLVASDEDRDRFETVLGQTTIPWPWAVFQDEGQARDWLTSP